jgi:tetratricopeptide (TPR) repeat protein
VSGRSWLLCSAVALTAVAAVESLRASGRMAGGLDVAVPLEREAFRAAYSLDFDHAVALGRRSVEMAPSESSAHRTLASMLWFDLLFWRGTITIDQYLAGLGKGADSLPKPPEAMVAEYTAELAQSIQIATARLKASDHDADARYDLGAAYALQATYQASVDGSVMAGFRSARRAYDAAETVLESQPQRGGALLIVGTYRYIVSGLSLPARLFAYVVGFGGGKERGIAMVESAARDPESHVDASVALVLIYAREKRHRDALRVLRQLEPEFPRNRLFVLEEGSAAIRAGDAAAADAALSRGIEMLDTDDRPRFPGESALWHYKRGKARVMLNRPMDALDDLQLALADDPAGWIKGRVHVELGRIDDRANRRAAAISHYRTAKELCSAAGDSACVADADRGLRAPGTP